MSQLPRWMQVPCCCPCALMKVFECSGVERIRQLVVPVRRECDRQRRLREAIGVAELLGRLAGELEALRQLAIRQRLQVHHLRDLVVVRLQLGVGDLGGPAAREQRGFASSATLL